MADKKKYVIAKCELKDTSLKAVKPDGILKAMGASIDKAINSNSKGKLTTKDKNSDGFLMTVSVTTLKGDDKDAPTTLEAKIGFVVMTIGSSTKAFTGSSGATQNGVSKDVQGDAEGLVTDILDSYMPKVISAMLSL